MDCRRGGKRGGIGKSALAFQFAALHQADFPGGVIGCQVNGKDLAAVAREFARKAGEPVREEDERDPAEIMQAVFAWRRALLIFDNAETTEIRELHPGGQCAALVTTRDRRLPVIIGAELLELPPLPEPEARVLLARFVGEERLNKEPEAAARILAVTGNLPLAVQIAGKFLQNRSRMPLKDYADSLSLARLTLARTDKESEDKNFSVRVCFNESVRLLEAEGRSRALILGFARLAACAQSGFALSTAMAAMDEPDSAAALDTLEELRNFPCSTTPERAAAVFFSTRCCMNLPESWPRSAMSWPEPSSGTPRIFSIYLKKNYLQPIWMICCKPLTFFEVRINLVKQNECWTTVTAFWRKRKMIERKPLC